jgi:DNA-binding winged helix-turn-helix (wHTH) protein/Tfp pilus assembly protein PilF
MQLSSTLSPPSPTRPCRIGEWTLDPARCSLAHRDGSAQRLEPKVAEVLGYLAARAGEVVPRQELLDALWPGVVVGDESLTQTVIKLRKALGDATREPRYIETIAKRGYRLIAPVREAPRARAPAARRWPAWGAVAALVVAAAGLAGSGRAPLVPAPDSQNTDALRLFASAQAAAARRSSGDGAAARVLYGEALEHDPTFARAYAASAVSHVRDFRYGFAKDGAAAMARALALATTARQIDPALPQGRFALAFVYLHQREHAAALAQLDEALQLDPAYSDAYGLKAHIRLDQGRTKEAIELARTAMRLTAQPTQIHFLLLGRAYYVAGDTEQALINLREAKARNTADLEARVYLAATYALLGRGADAEWEAEEIRALQPAFRAAAWLRSYPIVDPAQRQRLGAHLAALGL